MKGLDILVLEATKADECHPELRNLASDRSRIASQRVDGRETINKHRQKERRQISREVSEESVEDMLSGAREEGEESGGSEENGCMETDTVRLVLAEHLVRCLYAFRGMMLIMNQRARKRRELGRTSPSATERPNTGEELLSFAVMDDEWC